MAKVISYTLTPEGTIPSFVIDGGYYPSHNTEQETILIGIARDPILIGVLRFEIFTNNAIIYETKQELIAYLDTYFSELFDVNNLYTQETIPISSVEAADFIWAKLA